MPPGPERTAWASGATDDAYVTRRAAEMIEQDRLLPQSLRDCLLIARR